MGNPKAARRSHSQRMWNSLSESFDRIATFVDFGAHLLWSPLHSLQRACAAKLAQSLVFCCACETMSQAYCCGTVTARYMLSRFIVLLLGMVGQPAIFMLLVFSSLQMVGATCPNCHGSFSSCDYDTSNVCAGITAVAANVAAVVAGTGALTLKGLIKPRFMKMLSQISTEAILSLSSRPEPGTPLLSDAGTSGMKILGAINMGQITYNYAVASIMHLIDQVDVTHASAYARIAKYRSMMESLKGKANQRRDQPASKTKAPGRMHLLRVYKCINPLDTGSPWEGGSARMRLTPLPTKLPRWSKGWWWATRKYGRGACARARAPREC